MPRLLGFSFFLPFISILLPLSPSCCFHHWAISKISLSFLQDISRNWLLLFISISSIKTMTNTFYLDYWSDFLNFLCLSPCMHGIYYSSWHTKLYLTWILLISQTSFHALSTCLLLSDCTDLSFLWISHALSGSDYFLCPFARKLLHLLLKHLALSHL